MLTYFLIFWILPLLGIIPSILISFIYPKLIKIDEYLIFLAITIIPIVNWFTLIFVYLDIYENIIESDKGRKL